MASDLTNNGRKFNGRQHPIFIIASVSVFAGLFIVICHFLYNVIPQKEMGHNTGALGTYRTAIAIYRSNNGVFPTTIDKLFPKYLSVYPFAPDLTYPTGWFSYLTHPMGKTIQYVSSLQSNDSGGWMYDNNPQSDDFGKIIINCSHLSYRGKRYSEL